MKLLLILLKKLRKEFYFWQFVFFTYYCLIADEFRSWKRARQRAKDSKQEK